LLQRPKGGQKQNRKPKYLAISICRQIVKRHRFQENFKSREGTAESVEKKMPKVRRKQKLAKKDEVVVKQRVT